MSGAPRTALVAGASGLVGRALLAALDDDPRYLAVHALVRRPLDGAPRSRKRHDHVIDLARPQVPPGDDVFIALGTTLKAAGSEAAFRAVDFDAVLAVAKAARRAGAARLAVVSALGADARSRVFYNRVKGEMEAAVAQLGYEAVLIARPSLLAGDRNALGQPGRTGERLALAVTTPLRALLPARVRPIDAGVVARAMVRALAGAPAGVTIAESARLLQLGRTTDTGSAA